MPLPIHNLFDQTYDADTSTNNPLPTSYILSTSSSSVSVLPNSPTTKISASSGSLTRKRRKSSQSVDPTKCHPRENNEETSLKRTEGLMDRLHHLLDLQCRRLVDLGSPPKDKLVEVVRKKETQRHSLSWDKSDQKSEAEDGRVASELEGSSLEQEPFSSDSEQAPDDATLYLQNITKGFRRIFHSGQTLNMFESKLDDRHKKSPRYRDVKITINAQRNCGNTTRVQTSNSHNDASRTDVNAGNTHNTNHGSGSFEYVAGGDVPPERAADLSAGSSHYAPCACPDTPHYRYWINYVWSWVPCVSWDGWFSRFNGWMLQLLPQIMWG